LNAVNELRILKKYFTGKLSRKKLLLQYSTVKEKIHVAKKLLRWLRSAHTLVFWKLTPAGILGILFGLGCSLAETRTNKKLRKIFIQMFISIFILILFYFSRRAFLQHSHVQNSFLKKITRLARMFQIYNTKCDIKIYNLIKLVVLLNSLCDSLQGY